MPLKLSRYLIDLRKNALRFERIDINGVEDKSFVFKYLSRFICLTTAIGVVYVMDQGFSESFTSYISTVLSILIGLFITALIFSFDKFYQKSGFEKISAQVRIYEERAEEPERTLEIAIGDISEPNSKEKFWNTQGYNYTKQFSYIIGYNIVLSIICIILISFCTLFPVANSLELSKFRWIEGEVEGQHIWLFLKVSLLLLLRVGTLYLIGMVMYNTLFVVTSMVTFMNAKMDRTVD